MEAFVLRRWVAIALSTTDTNRDGRLSDAATSTGALGSGGAAILTDSDDEVDKYLQRAVGVSVFRVSARTTHRRGGINNHALSLTLHDKNTKANAVKKRVSNISG